jgi:EAL domain-containing protein (putative c-di-GMP-specific phosphodiesterase class I)
MSSPALVRQSEPGILMLDDDSFMLGVLSSMLRSMGYRRLRTADSAQVALALMQQEPLAIDVIVCDLNMPGMDGIEFLQTLNARGQPCSVILLSAEGARIMHTVQRLLADGHLLILGALEKPAARTSLGALLDCWQPLHAAAPAPELPLFTVPEVIAAGHEQPWLLHYQPKVNLRTGALTGLEALVRWNHPMHGLVLPDRFISLAEDCGIIDSLTDWVLQEALRQLAQWQARGWPVTMAVNLSMENLRSPGFAERVAGWARDIGAAPHDVMLELTESRLLSPSPMPLESLVRLRLQRFGLSIDDFGTGHSSLVQLRDIPFTELKVDRGFVSGARHNQIIRPILQGSIGIAKQMGMSVVAEGVETEDDWWLLRTLDCDLAQGWFIGRAMAPDQVPSWMDTWHSRTRGLVDS